MLKYLSCSGNFSIPCASSFGGKLGVLAGTSQAAGRQDQALIAPFSRARFLCFFSLRRPINQLFAHRPLVCAVMRQEAPALVIRCSSMRMLL